MLQDNYIQVQYVYSQDGRTQEMTRLPLPNLYFDSFLLIRALLASPEVVSVDVKEDGTWNPTKYKKIEKLYYPPKHHQNQA